MKKGILIGAVVFLAMVGFWLTRGDSGTRAIHKRLDALVEVVEKEGSVSRFETLGRARKLVEFFEPTAAIEYYPGRRLPKDLDAMQGAFMQIWGRLDSATVWIQKHKVELDASGETARSTFLATSRVMMNGEQQMGDSIKYQIDWVKLEGDWKIERVLANDPE